MSVESGVLTAAPMQLFLVIVEKESSLGPIFKTGLCYCLA